MVKVSSKVIINVTEEFTHIIAFYKALGLSKEELLGIVEEIYDSITEAKIVS